MNNKLTIYSKNGCPGCDSAKTLLTTYGIEYVENKVDEDDGARQFILSHGHRSVPQIYRGDELFVQGGWLGLKKLSEAEIKTLLYGESATAL